jgi:hypothetical protein
MLKVKRTAWFALQVLAGAALLQGLCAHDVRAAERGPQASGWHGQKGNAQRHGQGRSYSQRSDRGDRSGESRSRNHGHPRAGVASSSNDAPRQAAPRSNGHRGSSDYTRGDASRHDYDRSTRRNDYRGNYPSGRDYSRSSRNDGYRTYSRNDNSRSYRPAVYRYDRQDRYRHDRHYYRPPAHIVRHPSRHYTTVHVSGYPWPYYYSAGYYYRPYASNLWLSVTAPIGARVYGLPAGYVTFGYGGQTYYHAASTYYLYDGPARQYVVVEPPPEAPSYDDSAPASSGEIGDIFVYPARGQSDERTQRDRYECHLWAVDEVGVDPSLDDTDDALRADYRRALTACLEGRGYTVR